MRRGTAVPATCDLPPLARELKLVAVAVWLGRPGRIHSWSPGSIRAYFATAAAFGSRNQRRDAPRVAQNGHAPQHDIVRVTAQGPCAGERAPEILPIHARDPGSANDHVRSQRSTTPRALPTSFLASGREAARRRAASTAWSRRRSTRRVRALSRASSLSRRTWPPRGSAAISRPRASQRRSIVPARRSWGAPLSKRAIVARLTALRSASPARVRPFCSRPLLGPPRLAAVSNLE